MASYTIYIDKIGSLFDNHFKNTFDKAMRFMRCRHHNIRLCAPCDYDCLGCRHHTITVSEGSLATARRGDRVNIYGGGVHQSPQLAPLIQECIRARYRVRVFGNHYMLSLAPSLLDGITDIVIWCPSPIAADFDFLVGHPAFDGFKQAITTHAHRALTVAFFVRPVSFDVLPDFYDLCVDLRVTGWIYYMPHEFSREQCRYIQRFHRIKSMRVFKQKNQHHHHCLAVPMSMGLFEWKDWFTF